MDQCAERARQRRALERSAIQGEKQRCCPPLIFSHAQTLVAKEAFASGSNGHGRHGNHAHDCTCSLSAGELVNRARAGDRAAFGELMRRYRPRIYALALHLTGNDHDADDVAQEAFLRAYRSLGEFRAASEFFTWVYRIAVNLSLNVRRAKGRRRTTSMDHPAPDLAVQRTPRAARCPRRAAELRETYGRLVEALDKLSPALRSTC